MTVGGEHQNKAEVDVEVKNGAVLPNDSDAVRICGVWLMESAW